MAATKSPNARLYALWFQVGPPPPPLGVGSSFMYRLHDSSVSLRTQYSILSTPLALPRTLRLPLDASPGAPRPPPGHTQERSRGTRAQGRKGFSIDPEPPRCRRRTRTGMGASPAPMRCSSSSAQGSSSRSWPRCGPAQCQATGEPVKQSAELTGQPIKKTGEPHLPLHRCGLSPTARAGGTSTKRASQRCALSGHR